MVDRVLRTGKVAGWYIRDNVADDYRGYLLVEERSDRQWHDAELDAVIQAMEVASIENLVERLNCGETISFDEPTKISVLIEDECCRTFAPDPGECERVGIPIRRLTN
jgi:hypothetical protein